jgi:hypothetical protein
MDATPIYKAEATMQVDKCENCKKIISSDSHERDKWIPYYFDETDGLEHGSLCEKCAKLLGIVIDPKTTENCRPKQA